jgi:hypothetical protein
MHLFFRSFPPGALPWLSAGFGAVALQFVWPRLAMSVLLLAAMNTRAPGFAWVFSEVALWTAVPYVETGPTLWLLAVDAAAVALASRPQGHFSHTALALALLCARPAGDTVVWRILKMNVALLLGAVMCADQGDAGQRAPLQIALVLFLGPLYALYAIVLCAVLISRQTDVVSDFPL